MFLFPLFPGLWAPGVVDVDVCIWILSVRWVTFQKKRTFTILRSADIFDIWGFSKRNLLWYISRTGNPPKLLNYTPGKRREPFQIHFNMKSTAMNDFSARPIIIYQCFYLIIIIFSPVDSDQWLMIMLWSNIIKINQMFSTHKLFAKLIIWNNAKNSVLFSSTNI